MEYSIYTEQKYLPNGTIEARILTAAEAERHGYEDGEKFTTGGYTIYINGFDSRKAAVNYLNDVIVCTIIP